MCDRKSDVFIVPKKFCQHKQNGGKGDTFHRFGEETTVQTRRADNEDTPVEMVCYVKNMDIADIEKGMDAEIKLEAYPYNKYGTVDSEVTYISPGSFSHEQLGNVYLVKLSLNNQNEDIKIFTGLSGTVEIKTGKRTVMEYFLEPITKGFGESMKEK